MTFDLVTIGILFGVLLAGYLIGLLEAGLRHRRMARKQAAARSADEVAPIRSGELNLLSLWVDPARRLLLDLDGERLDPQALSDDHKQRLIELLTLIRPWLTGKSAPAPASRLNTAPPTETGLDAQAASVEPPAPAPVSLVEQIGDILHALLASTPYAGKGIHLAEAPDGSVIVYIGLTRYESIDAVPDEQIRQLIRKAVREWEKRNTR